MKANWIAILISSIFYKTTTTMSNQWCPGTQRHTWAKGENGKTNPKIACRCDDWCRHKSQLAVIRQVRDQVVNDQLRIERSRLQARWMSLLTRKIPTFSSNVLWSKNRLACPIKTVQWSLPITIPHVQFIQSPIPSTPETDIQSTHRLCRR